VGHERGGRLRRHITHWEIAEITVDFMRILLLLTLTSLYLLFVAARNARIREVRAASRDGPSEESGLLQNGQAENGSTMAHSNGYGSALGGGKHKRTEGAPPGWERPATTPTRSWWEYLKGYAMFFPYLWPSKDRKLQTVVVLCIVLVLAQRVVNFLVPYQVGVITDILSGENEEDPYMPWGAICLYILYRVLQGSNGFLGAVRSALWIRISQYSYRELSIAAFEHVHGLSLDFHTSKRTGEVLSALSKGNSINTFLEQVTFQVVPMLVDLCVAIAYFLNQFDAYYALVISVLTFWYIYLTIRMAQWRAEIRRQMVNADREEDAIK